MFDRRFRDELESRFRGRRDWERADLASVALSPERAVIRSWIDSEVSALEQPGRRKLIARLRDDKNFATAYNELAVAAVLRDAGLSLLYEAELDGLTPDLFAPSGPHGRPLVIEVWTRELPRSARGTRRAWAELVRRVADIPVPVAVLVQGTQGGTPPVPTSGDSKEIAASLRRWLLRGQRCRGDSHDVGSYRFVVFMEVPGLKTRMAAPTGGGRADSELVVRAIQTKVRRYRALVERLDASFVVVTASDPSTPLDVELLRSALGGRQSFSFSFSPAATGLIGTSSGPMPRNRHIVEFDSALSAVGFVEARLADPVLTLIPSTRAARPVPALQSDRLERAELA